MTVVQKVKDVEVKDVELPKIAPGRVVTNHVGQVWRDVHVNLPEGLTWQMLMDGADEIWTRVQAKPDTALSAGDRLVLKNYDQSEEATAVVCGANYKMVRLTGLRKYSYDARSTEVAASDDHHYVKFDGLGFGVWRKKDDVRMYRESFTSLPIAQKKMADLQPQKIGGFQ